MASSTPNLTLRPRTLMSVGKKQTIVTGGAGFIGSNLIAALNAREQDNIIIVDRLGAGEKWRNLQGLRFDDVVDLHDFRARVQESGLPQTVTVIHFGASEASPEHDADSLVDNNYRYSRELCEACLKSGARFIYASSASTYGAGDLGYFDNDAVLPKLRPLDVEAFSKHLFDLWALRSGALAKIAGLKMFNVYGPHEDHKGDRRSMVLQAFQQIRATGEVTLFKSHKPDYQDGEQQRDFIHVKDVVAMTLLFYDKPDVNGLFNCGTGRARTWADLARAVFAALEQEPKIRFVDMPEALRASFQDFTQADMTRARAAGFTNDLATLEDGVKSYVQDYLLPRKHAVELVS
jgi:ADP-L-glycero-D-manno-heptose 6-epimerase